MDILSTPKCCYGFDQPVGHQTLVGGGALGGLSNCLPRSRLVGFFEVYAAQVAYPWTTLRGSKSGGGPGLGQTGERAETEAEAGG